MTLERPRFTTTKLTEGYDMAAVDDAIDRVFAALAEPTPSMTRADVVNLRFTPTRLRQGYNMDEVDTWLDKAVAALDQHAGGSATPVADEPATVPTASSTRSDAIVEVSGGPSRVLLVMAALVVLAVAAYAVLG